MILTRKKRSISTFINLVLSVFLAAPVLAAEVPDDSLKNLPQRIQTCLRSNNFKKADFLLACFFVNRPPAESLSDWQTQLDELLKMRDLDPAGFLPHDYDSQFVEWFKTAFISAFKVGEEKVKDKYMTVEIQNVSQGKYFAALAVSPQIQQWYLLSKDSNVPSEPMLVVATSTSQKPTLFSGKIFQNIPSTFKPIAIATRHHALQYVWPVELHDLDEDGIPEIWVRYNLLYDNGFSQILDIYDVKDEVNPQLLKRFEGQNDGVARRLPDGRVETASGFAARPSLSRSDYDSHQFKTWRYQAGTFIEEGSHVTPHLLRSKEWKNYFLSDH